MKKLIAIAGLCLFAQPIPRWPVLPQFTLAGKPTFGIPGRTVYIIDCESTSACSVGGGSTRWLFADTGSAWVAATPVGGGGGGMADPGSNGVMVRTALNTSVARTLTGTTNQITVTNGDGVSGNPTLSIPTNPTLPGTTTGTFSGNLTGNASTATALATPRAVNGVAFDGTANIPITANLPANPAAGGAGEFANDIAADGTLTCATPAGGSGLTQPQVMARSTR